MVGNKGSGNTKVDGSISFAAPSSCEDMMQTKGDTARDYCVRVIWLQQSTLRVRVRVFIPWQLSPMDASECKAQPVNSVTSRQIVHSELMDFTT